MAVLRDKTQRAVTTLIEDSDAVIGLHARRPSRSDECFSVNADEVFPTASVIKIPVLMEFYRQAENGSLDPYAVRRLVDAEKVGGSGVLQFLMANLTSLALEDYVRLMINLSDNTATNVMIDLVGMSNVNTLLDSLGLKKTRLLRKMQDKDVDPDLVENLSTPKELSVLLERLMNRDGVSEYVSEKSLEILKLSKPGVIRDAVAGDYEIADKSGWMGGVECDSGVVYIQEPYIVTVMAKNISVSDKGSRKVKETLRRVVTTIHEYYLNTCTSTRFGRRI
jgi:beta-lactamase class A